jgi:micrococcal nuclease
MKNSLSFFFLIYIFLFLPTSELFAEELAIVRWIHDGDTIILNDNRCIRYIGINTPEIDHGDKKGEPFGYKAKQFNNSLVFKKKVRLEFDKERHDQYGRLLAYVFLPDGSFINEKILEQGYGFFLPRNPNSKYHLLLIKAQRKAMSEKKGIWHNWKEKEEEYIGNKKSNRFHLKTCRFGKKIRDRIYFSNRWDAFWEGYAPCKKCMSVWW